MIEYYISLLTSNSLKVFLLSMFPITELRFSIPYGYFVLNESIATVSIISIFGNILVGVLIIYIIGPIMNILIKIYPLSYIINKIFKRTKHKGKIINNLKMLGLIIFIGIPLPFTGVWTGSLASYLFGFSKIRSVVSVCLGVLISSFIIALICMFSNKLLSFLGFQV